MKPISRSMFALYFGGRRKKKWYKKQAAAKRRAGDYVRPNGLIRHPMKFLRG